jgi:hypothetical protein
MDLPCQPDFQRIDVSRWFGPVNITIQLISGSGQVLGAFETTVELYPPQQTGDFQCYDPIISVGPFPDGGL